MIYLDNASTTRMSTEALSAMVPYLQEQFGNPGSRYKLGRVAAKAVSDARTQAAMMFGAKPEHIVFTSGGSEGNAMIFAGLRRKLLLEGKNHIVLSAVEHDSVIKAAEALKSDGFYVTYVKPGTDGEVRAADVKEAIRESTGIVSIMYVNNETGAVNDIETIGKICAEQKVLFHSDCVQAAGQFKIDVERFGIDFATISGHKIHGPKGTGAIFIRDFDIAPLIGGGSRQEFGLRGGTENVSGIVAFGAACEVAANSIDETAVHTSTMKQLFCGELLKGFDVKSSVDAGVFVNGPSYLSTGRVLSLRVDGVDAQTLVLLLDTAGVCVSAGSACNESATTPSHVLTACGLTEQEARSTVRVSFSNDNTESEVVEAAAIFARSVQVLRGHSDI